MDANTTNKLGTAPVGRLLLELSIPAITAQIINLLYNVIDRIYIGHIDNIGHLALTGVGLCFSIIMIITAFSSLIGMGGAPRTSMMLGQGNHKKAEKVLGSCFAALLALSLILTVFFLIFSRKLLFLFGASPDTIDYGVSYMRIYVMGTVFVMIALGMNPFISAQGFAKVSMFTTMIGAILNIVLDPIFIFVFKMGVPGAALATVISQAVSAIWVLKFLMGKKTTLKLKKSNIKLNRAILMPVILLGLSPFIMQITESLLNICFTSSLQKYGGDTAVGAMTILSSVMQIAYMPLIGLTQGSQPIISYNFGAANVDRVKHTFRLLLTSALTVSCTFWLFNQLFPQAFASLFANNAELLETAAWALRIYMGTSFVMGVQNACQQTFIAIGQAKTSIFLALFRKILLLIPLIYILPVFFEDKVFAVFLAEPISDFIAAVVTGLMFMYQFKKVLNQKTQIQ